MKSKQGLRILNFCVAILLVFGNIMIARTPVFALSGTATSTATPSNPTPDVGDQITVDINIDVSGVAGSDNALGSYTGTLNWDPAILAYQSFSGAPPAGFTGVVNTASTGTGQIGFNGANASGAPGNTIVLTVTFNVVGAGTSALDLGISAMSAATTFVDLLPVLTVTDGSLDADAPPTSPLGLDGAVSFGTGVANATSVTFSHTTGTGTNRLMLVGVSWNSNTNSRTISSVTFSYGSGPTVLNLSEKIVQETGSTTKRFTAIWYSTTEPPQNTTGTVTVTFSGTVSNGIVVGVANFAGVDQTTPLGTAKGANSAATGTTVSVTLDSLNGNELVFDSAFIGASTPPDPTVDPSQSKLWTATVSNTRGVGSTKDAASNSSVTMSWTTGTTAVVWAIAAVPINPATIGTTYDLTVQVNPGGGGTTNPAVGVHTYAENMVVNISATPNSGYVFDSWTGDVGNPNSASTTVTMNSDKIVQANFVPVHSLTLAVTPGAGGSTSPAVGAHVYATGSVVPISATPASNYHFVNWTGGPVVDSNVASTSITMDADYTITANFALDLKTLTFAAGTGGTITAPAGLSPQNYDYGTVVSITAVASSGYHFANWSGDVGTVANVNAASTTITMSGDYAITANFAAGELVTLDGIVSSGTGAPTASSVSFSHTTGTGTNRLMLVGVSWNCGGTTNSTISSATFTPSGGSALDLTLVLTQQYTWQANTYRYTAIYSLLNPPSGVTGQINITFSTAVSNGIIAGAANFAGVDQTTPLGTPNGAVGTGTSTSGTPNPSVTLTGLTGDELVFDSVFMGASSTSHTMTADSGQTELWNILGYSSSSTSFNMRGSASTKQATGASATMSWTTGGYGTTATRWAIAAVPIHPATAVVSHIVTFSSNGGTGSMSSQTANIPTALTLNTFARTGYTFSHWNTAANGSGASYTDGETYDFTANITLFAQWTANTYTVTFDANGGSTPVPISKAVTYDSAYGTLATTSRTGYTFSGWFTAASGGTQVTAATVVNTAANHTLYAQWTANIYTVTFDANGGSTPIPTSKAVTYDSAYGTLATTSRTGYTFSGWFTAASGGTQVTAATVVNTAANHTLYAQWTANTYTVTFDANGGSTPVPTSKAVTYDSAYGTLATTSRTGYTFSGWFTAASGGTQVTAATVVNTAANHTLYAQWTTVSDHTVTFNSNGGTGSMSNQLANVPTALTLNTFTRNGFTFSNWNTAANGSGASYTDGETYDFTANITLFAQWTANTYTVTFDANGGSTPVPTSKAVTYDSAYGTLATTSRTGYTFSGWFTAASGGTQVTAATVVNTAANHTLYAQWTANTYTVTFDANGGSTPVPTSKAVTYDSAYGTLATTSRTSYTFSGWFTAASGGTQVTAATVVNTAANHTLYAQWTQNLVTYNVSLVAGWNLVSFDIHPANTAVADVLSSLGSNFDLVYAWNAGTSSWMKYDPSVGYGDTLTTLDETMGFWIYMNTADTLVVSGTLPTTSSITLKTGWNLVGFPAAANLTLPEAFSAHGVGTDFSLVYAYHASDTADTWKVFDRLAPVWANDLTELAPGWGFWVKVSADHTWVVVQ